MYTATKLFLTLILLPFLATSQNDKFGPIGGVNYSKITGNLDEISDSQRRLAYHIGFFRDFKFSDKLLFKPQILYSLQGDYDYEEGTWPNIDGTTSTYIFDVNSRYEYISLPLEFRYVLKNEFSLVVGPQIQYILQAGYNGDTIIDGVKEKTKDSYGFEPKLDYGFVLGISYALFDKFFADLKYYQGVSNTNRGEMIFVKEDTKTNNSVFKLSVGYYLF